MRPRSVRLPALALAGLTIAGCGGEATPTTPASTTPAVAPAPAPAPGGKPRVGAGKAKSSAPTSSPNMKMVD